MSDDKLNEVSGTKTVYAYPTGDGEENNAANRDSETNAAEHEKDGVGTISSDLIRGHINTIILRALYERDKYGYEIINDIESKSHGQYTLKQPTLYSALKRLDSQGYIRAYWKTDEVTLGGRRKYFTLTDAGREITERNLAEWEYSRTIIDSLISDRDFDFNRPAPTPVDFKLLRSSVSRVPRLKDEEDERLELTNTESTPCLIETTELKLQYSADNENAREENEKIIAERVEAEIEKILKEKAKQDELEAQQRKEIEEAEQEAKAEQERIEREEKEKRDEEERLLREQEEAEKAYEREQFLAEREQFDREKAQFEEDKARFDDDKSQLKADRAQLSDDKAKLEEDKAKLDEDAAQLQDDKAQFEEDKAQLDEDKERLQDERESFDQERAAAEEKAETERLLKEQADEKEAEEKARREQEEAEQRERFIEEREQFLAEKVLFEEDKEKLQTEREAFEQEKAEAEAKAERERILKEQAEEEAIAEKERLEKEREEAEAQAEKDRLAAENERLLAEQERLEKERKQFEQEKAEAEAKAEQERLAKEQAEAEAKAEQERLAKEQAEAEAKAERERLLEEQKRLAREREQIQAEREKFEREKAEEKERAEKERILAEQEREHEERERAERERQETSEREAEQARQVHENYLRLINEPVRERATTTTSATSDDVVPNSDRVSADSLLYNNKPEAERDYRNLINGIYSKAVSGDAPRVAEPRQPTRTETYETPRKKRTGEVQLIEKGRADGVTINSAEKTKNEFATKTTYNKGLTLFKSSLVVLAITVIEFVLCFVFKDKLEVNWTYPAVILLLGIAQFALFGIMAWCGFGKVSVRPTGSGYVITCAVLTLILVLIVVLSAFLMNMRASVLSDVLKMAVIPAFTACNITFFAIAFKGFMK